MASAHPPLQQFIELDMEELAEFVEEEISAHAATVVQECGLNGAAFLLLEESDIREQWTVLRERIHITTLEDLQGTNGVLQPSRKINFINNLIYYKFQQCVLSFFRPPFPQPAKYLIPVDGCKTSKVDKVYSIKTMEYIRGEQSGLSKGIRAEISTTVYCNTQPLQHLRNTRQCAPHW